MKTSSSLRFSEVKRTIHRHLGIPKAFSIAFSQDWLFSPSLDREDSRLDRKMEQDLRVCCLTQRTWSNIAEQSHAWSHSPEHRAELRGGSSSTSSLAGILAQTHTPSSTLHRARGCSTRESERQKGRVAAVSGAGP